jgi:hypothetical protein
MSDTNKEKRSPLKRKPLRNPGQSLQQEIQHIHNLQEMPLAAVIAMAIAIAIDEWWRHFAARPPQPIGATLIAAVVVACCVYLLRVLRKRLTSLQLGLDGEKTIGQLLEANRRNDWYVFHDIPCNGFNIDHVVIAPQGVFAIETKTRSKPAQDEPTVTYNGESVEFKDSKPDRKPIRQARAVSNWLREFLHRSTGMDYPVRGVVIPLGWYVRSPKDGRPIDIWVLNEKAFLKWVENEPVVLTNQEIAWASERLTSFVAG